MRIIFSKDRSAQLDLLLRSIDRYMAPEETKIIWEASSYKFRDAYELWVTDPVQGDFNTDLREALATADETVTFFCDDDVVYRQVPTSPGNLIDQRLAPNKDFPSRSIFTISLRLGRSVVEPLPEHFPIWRWPPLERHDFGFPCSVDGHTFRTADVIRLIGSDNIPNPTMLETVMAHRASLFEEERPLMACFAQQCLVGVPVNRVSDQSGVPYGQRYPQTTQEMNKRFLNGERIDLDALDFSGVDSCHHEIEFVWK